MLRNIVAVKRVLYDAIGHFTTDDGWAMASAIKGDSREADAIMKAYLDYIGVMPP